METSSAPLDRPLSVEEWNNARVGYQAAVQLWAAATQVMWARFNAMLVANTFCYHCDEARKIANPSKFAELHTYYHWLDYSFTCCGS